jgi:ribosomal protein L11 methylase PrmA
VSALDPGAAFGTGLDAATEAATSAASAIDPLAFLGL